MKEIQSKIFNHTECLRSKNGQSTLSDSHVFESQELTYHSIQEKTKELAEAYAKTDSLSHRYLAWRDLPSLIQQYVSGKNALDYGAGTGISANFLQKLGMNVIGTDIHSCMLDKARESFPDLHFCELNELTPLEQFDLVFSCFVLFDLNSKSAILDYLNKASSFMKKGAVFIGITGSEELYSVFRNWTAFDSQFPENWNLQSGDVTKLKLKNPEIEFCDYFWKEEDYIECFQMANLKILKIHTPIGSANDPYQWEDEKFVAPFTVYVLKKE